MKKKLAKFKEYSPEELKSIINFIKNPVDKLIAEKLLLGGKEKHEGYNTDKI